MNLYELNGKAKKVSDWWRLLAADWHDSDKLATQFRGAEL